MTIDLHCKFLSPPSRAVMILAKNLGLELTLVDVDLMTGAHLSPDFAKLNPMKVIPVLVDNGFVLGESRAILSYLVNQYSPGHEWYPTDAKKRAEIDRVMYLTAELFQRGRVMGKAVIRDNKWPVPQELVDNYVELLKVLEQLVAGKKFLTGDQMSIADISFICDVTSVFSVDIGTVAPGIADWIKLMSDALPDYEEFITKPREQFKMMIEARTGVKMT